MTSSVIVTTGSYLPDKIVTNDDLAKFVDTSNEWIASRTGITQRHFADDTQSTSFMATQAAKKALENSNINRCDIDLVIVATTTPDQTFPSVASVVQSNLKLEECPAFDLQAVCSGFIYALSVADSFIKSAQYKNILVIGAEKMSSVLDFKDRNTCVLFGDGAGAVVLSATNEQNRGIIQTKLYSDGEHNDILKTSGGVASTTNAGKIFMAGKDVFKHAVNKMSQSIIDICQDSNVKLEDINFVIPHQANARIIDKISSKLSVPPEKMISTVELHANTSAASIPLALDYANSQNKLAKGNMIALTALGGGLTWGSALIRW